MNKKYIFLAVLGVLAATSVGAITNCDSQPKPAIGCPPGYSMMCSSGGGTYHWACGKESAGAVLEVGTESETAGVKSTMQTQVKVEGQESEDVESESITSHSGAEAAAKVEVRGWDPDKKEAISQKIETALENNEDIRSAVIEESNVEITYSAPAKLFALFPIKMNIKVSADAEGMIKVKFPWYKFLVTSEFSNISAEISGVMQSNQTDLEFLKLQDSAERQSQLFNLLSNILKARHDISL